MVCQAVIIIGFFMLVSKEYVLSMASRLLCGSPFTVTTTQKKKNYGIATVVMERCTCDNEQPLYAYQNFFQISMSRIDGCICD